MITKDDTYYFNIGGKTIYFYRNKDLQRNCFGLMHDGQHIYPNHANDVSFDNPEHYLAIVLSFLEQQSEALDREVDL
ncbi:hypothetical protein N9459_04295 [Flavobacteriaceae bacterium]|nr:hypothetical protein [Flavobacteriaceae bacterium]